MPDIIVRARIDEHVKEEASAVLATVGLTVSDALRLMMIRIATDKALPLVPNAETIEAMQAARRGDLTDVGSIDALLADLDADDLADLPVQAGLSPRAFGRSWRQACGISAGGAGTSGGRPSAPASICGCQATGATIATATYGPETTLELVRPGSHSELGM